MLVNSKEMLLQAQKRGFAIPATNFIDLDSARSYVEVAEERGLPLILAFAQSHKNLISLEEAALIGRHLAKNATVPIALHLDHGEDKEFIFQAIDLGFESVMIDASSESFDQNIKVTKEVVAYAKTKGVTVEAELGHVGSGENYENHEIADSVYTEVNDVIEFVEKTNIDSLAISIGTAHGSYTGVPEISFERLEQIAEVTQIPLVLHGGSSSGDNNLKHCALNGISKINIFTDLLNAALKEINTNTQKDYLTLKSNANLGMKKMLNHYYDVFETKSLK